MLKTTHKVSNAADSVKPYVRRAVTDEELRENLKSAFAAAREVYDELVGGRGMAAAASKVATDKEIQDNLRKAVEELRGAADRIQGKARHGSRNTTLLLTGIALGILFNPMTGPETRRRLKERVFGPSDERGSTSGSSDSG